MSNESHPSPTGSSSSSLFGGGGGAGVNEPLTQPSPAKPTWAQILNSNPNAPSNTSSSSTTTTGNNAAVAAAVVVAGNNSSSSSPSSQHSATTKTISPSTSGGTSNITGSRPGFMPSFYEQQQWPLNFNQPSSWMINDDDSQRQQTNPSQQSIDNSGGDGFDRLESSSPTTDWNKPVTTNNSTVNGWSNFQQQQNPSRSNPNNNQWPEMNNMYGANTPTNSFNNDNNSSSTWQDPSSSGNASDTLTLTTNNSKHKSSSSMAASLTGALKSAIALSGNVDLLSGNSESMISYVPQPKLVEQLGWDEPDINVLKRGNFDDGTSIWGDPMESVSVPVKKWTNGTKAALTNSTNIDLQQQQQQQQTVQKPISTTATTSRGVLNDENWPKQQSPTIIQQQPQQQPPPPPPSSSSQWNDTSSANIDQTNSSQQHQQTYRTQPNWNPQSQPDDWFRDGVVDTSDWGLQGPPHKAPFDPYEGQVDTSGWGVQGAGGMPGQLAAMGRNRFMNEYDLNENPHDVRMPGYDNQPLNDPYRQNPDLKNPMMPLSSHHPFPPRPGSLYPHQPGNILRPINPNGGLSTPPGAIIGQSSHPSPKLPTSSPVPNPNSYKQSNISNPSSQTPTPSQQQPTGNGNGNGNNNNNGAVHAQIMQQFRLAVQAGLITQDLLNTKLPPYMLQLLQKLFELQQKFQQLSLQLSELSKNKPHFPLPLLQNEYERLTKLIQQKKQEMLIVQKEIQDAHTKLKQQQSTNPTPTPTQMMSNGPTTGQNSDQSRLTQWTKQSTIGGQRTTMFPPPPGLTQKDWQTDNNDPNENWENTQTNESNNNNNNNQVGNVDPHTHNNQASSAFSDPFSNLVDDIDGPPPFVPGQLWNWKSLPNAEDDPHVTPSSFTIGPKGPASPMGNLNVGGAESAFSNPQLMHPYQRQLPTNRSQWQQGPLHDQQGFQPPMNDWPKQQQYRGTSKAPPPPHPSFGGGGGGGGGGYRPYM